MLINLRNLRCWTIAAVWLAITCSTAFAHGGIAGPDELGPPVITSAVLGIVGYWTVMLWPSRKGPGNGNGGKKATRRPVR
ncbi:MAG TPA: hypothetical protein VJN94_02145 [Candidatus Binataceae bacterium]|nr:hypothetical protein [Candidatus Binataceae bacterium]